eukprot:CAMPEP_0172840978 /NCGR_PEP_ID=MMETSP1075-20121228/29698_1 /TAXON_ID=2916 /ORGANISM="Ceratium fusus, Strain PA161109" /LENGTH=65 /DNA_ID=CAMNT_0013684897 /DNA_START=18 /DNA_END=212 /DNA_ORIENTATION=+
MSRRSSRRNSDSLLFGNTAPVQFASARRRTDHCFDCGKEKPVIDFEKPVKYFEEPVKDIDIPTIA